MLEVTEISSRACAFEIELARNLSFWYGFARLRAADRFCLASEEQRGGDCIRMFEATCLSVPAVPSYKEVADVVLHRGGVVRWGSRLGSSLFLFKCAAV